MFSNLRLTIAAILAALWSFGVWHISAGYAENKFNQERIVMLKEQDNIRNQNAQLQATISKSLQEGLAESREQIQKSIQEGLNDIKTNPIYTTCRITDGVRNGYRSAIKSQ